MKILFLVSHPIEGAATRYRVYQYLPYLEKKGIQCRVRPFISDRFYKILYKKGKLIDKVLYFILCSCNRLLDILRALKYDIIFIQRDTYPIGPPIIEFILSKILLKTIIYDFDDAIYLTEEKRSILSILKNSKKIKKIIKWSSHVIVGNNYLKKYALQFNKNTHVIMTPIETNKFKKGSKSRSKRIIIGWIGSYSTTKYLSIIQDSIKELAKKYDFELRIIGANKNIGIPGVNVTNRKWSLGREVADFQELTIGIYPLINDEWALGKCGFKAIQYMATGVPTIASPVGVNKDIISDGANGFLASNKEEWIAKLSQLIEDHKLREKFSINGRKTINQIYAVHRNFPKLLSVLNTSRRINIMQLISDLEIGGTEKMLVELVKGLDKSRYNLTVCSVNSFGPVAEEIKQINGVNLVSLNVQSKFNFLVFFQLYYLLKKYKITILQSYLFFDNFIARIVGKAANIPIIVAGQRYLNSSDRYWRLLLDRIFAKNNDLIIANSYAAKKGLITRESIPGKKIRVIHNGKDSSQFHATKSKEEIKQELGIKAADYVVGILARLHDIKNHELFLNTAAEILTQVPNVKFVIAGEGKLKNELIGYARRLRIQKNVIFTGNIKNVTNLINIFDISMLTSKFESLPGSLIESMALSKPIVATPVGGVTELVSDKETGFLGSNKTQLSEAVILLLKNKSLRNKMGRAGRKKFEREFTAETMIKKYDEIYKELLINKGYEIRI